MPVMYSAITMVHGEHNASMDAQMDQVRLFVYSKHGRYDICSDCDGTKVCLSNPDVNLPTLDQNGIPVDATMG